MKSQIYCIGKKRFALTKDNTIYELVRKRWQLIKQCKSEIESKLTILELASHSICLNANLEDFEK